MGDILGAIFGTSSETEQETVPDVIQQETNRQLLNQLVNFFQTGGGLNQFTGPSDTYIPTNYSTDIGNIAHNNLIDNQNINFDNLISLDDYRRSFDPVTRSYDASLNNLYNVTGDALGETARTTARSQANVDAQRDAALRRSYGDYSTGTNTAAGAYAQGSGDIDAAYNAAVARGDYDLARSLLTNEAYANRALGTNEAYANRSLATQDANRLRALELGIGATGNYVDQIARPRLEQALALQGLERGAAIPAAIARATAEQAMPYLQSIENTYGTNQANTLNALLGLQSGVNTQLLGQQGSATEAAAAGNRALGGQRLGAQASLASGYQNNVAQLAQALMANNISLEQAGISANSALGQQLVQAQTALRGQQQQGITSLANTYGSNAANFAQSLPGASNTITQTPLAARNLQANYLNALQPLADFPRQLSEADYLRRQNLFSTVYTGIPFQTGSTTFGGTATGNIFDQLGGTIQSGLRGGGNLGGT